MSIADTVKFKAALEKHEHFVCPECGPHIAADEDGCCALCGADCILDECPGSVCASDYVLVKAERDRALSLATACAGRDQARAELECEKEYGPAAADECAKAIDEYIACTCTEEDAPALCWRCALLRRLKGET